MVEGLELARQAGNIKMVSTVMVGGISCFVGIADEFWKATIKESVPKGTEDANLQAFELGRNAVKEKLPND